MRIGGEDLAGDEYEFGIADHPGGDDYRLRQGGCCDENSRDCGIDEQSNNSSKYENA